MKNIIMFLSVLIVSGCKPNQHIWDELDRCKKKYSEVCTVIVIPDSKFNEAKELSKGWL